MTKDVIWTKAVIEAFIDEGNLNPRQEYIVRTRAQGCTIVEQATHLHLSTDQVNKDIRNPRAAARLSPQLLQFIYILRRYHGFII